MAVFGPGLLGLLMLQVARAAGATTVIMVGRGERLAVARELGCTAVVDYERDDPVAGVRAATGGRGADCVFDCSGNTGGRRPGAALRSGAAGRWRCSAWPAARSAELPVDLVTLDELDVLGVRSSPNAYPAMIALLASGAIRTEPLTTDVYPLADVAAAFGALARREAIRPIITMPARLRRAELEAPRCQLSVTWWTCPPGRARAGPSGPGPVPRSSVPRCRCRPGAGRWTRARPPGRSGWARRRAMLYVMAGVGTRATARRAVHGWPGERAVAGRLPGDHAARRGAAGLSC